MVPEASLEQTEHGVRPRPDGWFVANARETRWFGNELGRYTVFDSEDVRFEQIGVGVGVLRPGEPNCMYHGEGAQEDFLVLSGECLLVVEGEERRLKAWDFVHCPPWTEHVFVGAGDGPCVVLAVGARKKGRGVALRRERDGAPARRRGRGGDDRGERRVREIPERRAGTVSRGVPGLSGAPEGIC